MRRTSSPPTPTRSASAPACFRKAPPSRWRCFRRCCWWWFSSSGTSDGSRTDDRGRQVEEVGVVLPAAGHVHPRAAVPVLLDGGDHRASRRRTLPPVEPPALLAVLDRQPD